MTNLRPAFSTAEERRLDEDVSVTLACEGGGEEIGMWGYVGVRAVCWDVY